MNEDRSSRKSMDLTAELDELDSLANDSVSTASDSTIDPESLEQLLATLTSTTDVNPHNDSSFDREVWGEAAQEALFNLNANNVADTATDEAIDELDDILLELIDDPADNDIPPAVPSGVITGVQQKILAVTPIANDDFTKIFNDVHRLRQNPRQQLDYLKRNISSFDKLFSDLNAFQSQTAEENEQILLHDRIKRQIQQLKETLSSAHDLNAEQLSSLLHSLKRLVHFAKQISSAPGLPYAQLNTLLSSDAGFLASELDEAKKNNDSRDKAKIAELEQQYHQAIDKQNEKNLNSTQTKLEALYKINPLKEPQIFVKKAAEINQALTDLRQSSNHIKVDIFHQQYKLCIEKAHHALLTRSLKQKILDFLKKPTNEVKHIINLISLQKNNKITNKQHARNVINGLLNSIGALSRKNKNDIMKVIRQQGIAGPQAIHQELQEAKAAIAELNAPTVKQFDDYHQYETFSTQAKALNDKLGELLKKYPDWKKDLVELKSQLQAKLQEVQTQLNVHRKFGDKVIDYMADPVGETKKVIDTQVRQQPTAKTKAGKEVEHMLKDIEGLITPKANEQTLISTKRASPAA